MYGFYCSRRGGRQGFSVQANRQKQIAKQMQKLVVSLVDTKDELLAGVLERVDAYHRHHRARGSCGKTLPHFTVDDYVIVARVSRYGKHRKLVGTWGPRRVANDDKKYGYAVQHLVTGELRDVHVATMRFTLMSSSRSLARSLRCSSNWNTRASITSGAISAIKRAASRNKFVDKEAWRRRRAPRNRCRACSMTRRSCCGKSSRRCGWKRSRCGRSYSGLGGVPNYE